MFKSLKIAIFGMEKKLNFRHCLLLAMVTHEKKIHLHFELANLKFTLKAEARKENQNGIHSCKKTHILAFNMEQRTWWTILPNFSIVFNF